MKKNLSVFIPVAIAILLGSLTYIFAQRADVNGPPPPPAGFKGDFPPPPPPGDGRHGPGRNAYEKLNLNDTQKEQIKAMEDASHEASREFFGKLRAADEQLRLMIENGNFSADQARPILKDKAQNMTELELIRLGTEAAIQRVLTAEQKTQLAQIREKRPPFPPGGGFRPGER